MKQETTRELDHNRESTFHSDRGGSTESGFTLLEVLIVVAIIGLLASIAIPAGRYQIKKARAMSIVSDFVYVRDLTLEHYLDHGFHPKDRRRGKSPPELEPYGGNRVVWRNERLNIEYEWDNYLREGRKPKHRRTGIAIGFTLRTKDQELKAMVEELYDGPVYTRWRNRLVFIIEST